MTADGEKITFRGPGQWRSQADKPANRPPAGVLEPPAGKRAVATRALGPEHQAVLGEISRCGGVASTRALRSRQIIDGWDFSLGAALSALVRVGLVAQAGEGDDVAYYLTEDDEGGDNPFV